jgi:tetratricopeptide (TPR) repeat protein
MLMDTGNYYLDKGRYDKALSSFDSIAHYYPYTSEYNLSFYYRAKCKMGLNNTQEALDNFSYFLQLDNCKSGYCTDVHYSIGVLKFKKGEIADAMGELQLALPDSAFNNHKFCYFYLAFCYAQNEDFIHAVQNLTLYLTYEKQPTYSRAEALYYRGYYKAQLKDNRGAIKDYDEAIQLYQTAVQTNNTLYIQKLIDTYIVRGLAKAELKRFDEAIMDYDLVLKINPKYAMAYRLKGQSEIGKGLTDAGCLDLSRAGELGSSEAYDDIKAHCK